jgi:2-oxoglutarate decarboxylase
MAQTATVQIEMPEMGESVTEGIVLEWHVAEGDFVNEGDTVVEISTDKVDAEVPAPVAGVITKLLASVDDEVPVGAALAEMAPGDSGEGSSGSTAGPDAAAGGPAGGGGASVLGPPDSTPPAEEAAEPEAEEAEAHAAEEAPAAEAEVPAAEEEQAEGVPAAEEAS